MGKRGRSALKRGKGNWVCEREGTDSFLNISRVVFFGCGGGDEERGGSVVPRVECEDYCD